MRVISKTTLIDFWTRHPDAKGPLEAWFDEVRRAKWTTTQDIKNRYASASFVGNNRVVFNIKGNSYRLVVSLGLRTEALFIKFIGTHAEYDKIDAATV